jgi:hypothetical protein
VCILSEQKALIAPYRRHFQRWETNMKIARMIAAGAALILVTCSGAIGAFSPAHALTHQELVAKLESAGYSRIQDIKPTPEGTVVKAMKNGKEVSLVVDSTGQIQEQR